MIFIACRASRRPCVPGVTIELTVFPRPDRLGRESGALRLMVARLAACVAGVVALVGVGASAQQAQKPTLAAASAPLPPAKPSSVAARERLEIGRAHV